MAALYLRMGLYGSNDIEYTCYNKGSSALHTFKLSAIEEHRLNDALQYCY